MDFELNWDNTEIFIAAILNLNAALILVIPLKSTYYAYYYWEITIMMLIRIYYSLNSLLLVLYWLRFKDLMMVFILIYSY